MKDDLKKTNDHRKENPKGEKMPEKKQKKSTEQTTETNSTVDNSHEEEIPEWKSSIRRETPEENVKPEKKFNILAHKRYIAAAAAIVILGGVAFGVAPVLVKQGTSSDQAISETDTEDTDTSDSSQ